VAIGAPNTTPNIVANTVCKKSFVYAAMFSYPQASAPPFLMIAMQKVV